MLYGGQVWGPGRSGDIALVQLAAPVTLTSLVQPICLPEASDDFPPKTACWVTGWGHTQEGGEDPQWGSCPWACITACWSQHVGVGPGGTVAPTVTTPPEPLRPPYQLQEARVSLVDMESCQRDYPGPGGGPLRPDMLCAQGPGDACQVSEPEPAHWMEEHGRTALPRAQGTLPRMTPGAPWSARHLGPGCRWA